MTNEQQIRKRVIQQLPHFWGYAIGSGVIAVLLQLISLIPPLIMQNIVDLYIPQKAVRELCIGIIWFILLPVLSTGIASFYKYKTAVICRRFGQSLTLTGFERLMAQPLSFFENQNSAELTTYCRKEAVQYVYFWLGEIPSLIASLVQGVVIFGCLTHINLWIAAIALLYCPISYFPSNYFGKCSQKLGKRIVENNGKMNQIIMDTFKGIRFVKSMAIEKTRIQKLEKINNNTVSIWGRMALLDNLTFLWVNDFSNALFLGTTFAMGAFFAIQGKATVGECILILNYVAKFFSAAQTAMRANYDFKVELGEYDRLFEILTLPIPSEDQGKKPFTFQNHLVLSHIAFQYREDRGQVLDDLNLTIRKGEWLGIIGQSGAGKTTIFDLLMRLYEPQSGEITLDGVPLSDYSLRGLRQGITKVSQETVLFPGSIRDNLLPAAPDASDGEIMQALEKVCLKDFVRNLPEGLDTIVGEDGLLLSGGERQRLGLAQGLLKKSALLLIDEGTANIDQESETIIRTLLRELVLKEQISIVSISHRPEFLADTDRIVVVKDGKISEETTYERRYK